MSPTAHGRKYGEKESRPIPVWNGILEHCGRIDHAIWEFLWCIDKVTEERDGIGVVLGGAPVKIPKIAADLRQDEKTIRLHLATLEKHGYIQRTRTPYGFVVRVLNSRKFGIWRPRENGKDARSLPGETTRERPVSPAEMPDLSGCFARNKEDAAVDSTVDAAEDAAAAWKAIGTERLGTPRFRAKWEFLFAHRNGNPLSDAMERCIVGCQGAGVKVPPPFFDAKRRVEASETVSPARNGKGGGLPLLEPMPPLPCPSRS